MPRRATGALADVLAGARAVGRGWASAVGSAADRFECTRGQRARTAWPTTHDELSIRQCQVLVAVNLQCARPSGSAAAAARAGGACLEAAMPCRASRSTCATATTRAATVRMRSPRGVAARARCPSAAADAARDRSCSRSWVTSLNGRPRAIVASLWALWALGWAHQTRRISSASASRSRAARLARHTRQAIRRQSKVRARARASRSAVQL